MSSKARIETFQGKDGNYYNKLIAANNEVLMVSEGYPDKGSATDGRIAATKALDVEPAPEMGEDDTPAEM